MRTMGRRLVACGAVLAVGALVVAGNAASQTKKPVVFNVGYTQGIDSMNPVVGVTVASGPIARLLVTSASSGWAASWARACSEICES